MTDMKAVTKKLFSKTQTKNTTRSCAPAGRIITTVSLIFLIILFLFINASPAHASVIGASKGVINYENVLKNGYAQEQLTLTTDTDYNLSVSYKTEGEIADWITILPEQQPYFISEEKPQVVTVIVEPPGDIRNQLYKGSIRFLTGALAGPEGQFGTAVRAAINLKLGVEITGQEIVRCEASGFRITDVEEGYPMEFQAIVSNLGNVRINPDFVLEFWNQDQTELIQSFSFQANQTLLPTVQEKIFRSIEHNLDIGQYWVKISSPLCGNSGFITMSVIERGGVSDRGELLRIENEPWAETGDIIPIDAVFKNLGSRVVSAKFKGTISSGEEIFKIIDTDPLDVMPGQLVNLRTYFNPMQAGQYMITGRVLYNKKLTFEKSSVLNVNPAGEGIPGEGGSAWTVITIILFIAIIALIILILTKKKGKQRKKFHRK